MLSRWQRYLRTHPRSVDVTLALVPVFIAFPGLEVSLDGAPVPARPGRATCSPASPAPR